MSFGGEYKEPAEFGYAFAEFNVGAATCHVSSNGYRALLAGAGNDVGLERMLFSVEYLMRYFCRFEHTAQCFRRFDRGCTHQNRLTFGMGGGDELNGVRKFFSAGFEDDIIFIHTNTVTVGGNGDDAQSVDIVKL
jgi:hypothetical protein